MRGVATNDALSHLYLLVFFLYFLVKYSNYSCLMQKC